MESWVNTTVRLREDGAWVETAASGWPKIYGTVVAEEEDVKVRVRWGNGTLSWELRRDLYVLD